LIRDTMELDATDEQEILDQLKKEKDELKKDPKKKESNDDKLKFNTEAILPNEKKKPELRDSLR